MIPMMEARASHESAYLREYAECMYRAAKRVQDSDEECCGKMHKASKHYRRAAKELVRDCDDLREIVFGGSSRSVYDQMKEVEEDFVRLSNLCE
jgi:prephenate dehydrogenase